MREDFERDGFVIVPEALCATEVRRLRAAVDRVWEDEAGSAGMLHRLAFVGLDDAFLELVDHPRCLPLVSGVLGPNVYVYHCHLDVHPPEPRAEPRWRWHQDGGRQNVELESPRPRLSVKVAYFLTDVPTAEHGALRVVPGSQVRDTLSRDREPADAVPVLVEAGSAVVFDRRLWHARGDNVSDRTRKVLFYGYTHRWIRPRDELTLDPDRLTRLTPLRRRLLGYAEDTKDYWFPAETALRSRMPL
jgi:ectoine hydroxylase-related dioxygenase (phytanoyl-CoA dioxygenase family)